MPRDCTAEYGFHRMYSPCVTGIHIMTKKNKRNVLSSVQKEMKALRLANAKLRGKKATPFGDVGEKIGDSLGGLFKLPMLKGVGKWLGSGIGSIFGSGDYQMSGPQPRYNVLAGQTPRFSTSQSTNIVSHREYLGDITGATAFANLSYPLNPGINATFPWMSTIASNYQQYKFHGIIFEFRSLITDFVTGGAPGVLAIATNYNADQTPFDTRQEAENSEYAVATKPTLNLVHMVECADDQVANKLYYVRTGAPPAGQDLRNFDYGLTQFITQSNPSQVLGELWVSYVVEFFKPTMSSQNGSIDAQGFHTERTSATPTNPMGTIQVTKSGTLTTVTSGTTLSLNCVSGMTYQLNWLISGGTPATVALPIPTISGGTFVYFYQGGTDYKFNTTGTLVTFATESLTFVATAATTLLTFPGTGVFPGASCTSEVYVSLLDTSITA